jgi:hypothetical protein
MFARIKARAPQAIARSLNRAAVSARVVMVREIARDLSIKQGDVKIHHHEASPAKHATRLSASLKRIPLIKFGARGPEPSRGRGTGVTARTRTRRYPHAFIATMKSGHKGVFQRMRTSRLPIRELFGPSIGHVFRKYRPLGLARAIESFNKNLQAELKFALRG